MSFITASLSAFLIVMVNLFGSSLTSTTVKPSKCSDRSLVISSLTSSLNLGLSVTSTACLSGVTTSCEHEREKHEREKRSRAYPPI